MSASTKGAAGPDGISLLEQSIHLLRQAPAQTLLVYYAATVPWVLGVLFFWAQVTWFTPAPVTIAWWALGLTLLFTAMKAGQSDFCARLLAQRLGDPAPAFTITRWLRLARVQLRVQGWGLALVPLAAVLGLPFGWVFAYYQSATVLGDAEDVHTESTRQSGLWAGQNHLGLLFLFALSIAAAINLAAAFWLVPWLANRLLGIENMFGFSGWWFANTTFLASIVALVWLSLDPLVKAFYTLRVFHGRSRATGEDLRVDLNLARTGRKGVRGAAITIMAVAVGFLATPRLRAEAADAQPVQTVTPATLDRAIDEVLSERDFQWHLRPPVSLESSAKADGPIKHFFRQGITYIRDFTRWIWREIKRAWDWISDLFPASKSGSTAPTKISGIPPAVIRMLLYLFLGTAAVLIIGLVIAAVYRSGDKLRTLVKARPAVAGVPDLRDEATQAAQLPVDGWLALARKQLAKGEVRLALRALQLATLARLADEGLISLAKSKTNLDYERELRRRAVMRQELVTTFAQRRGTFESVWYGSSPAQEAEIRAWLAELEQTPQAA